MLSIIVNIAAFCLGAICFERWGSLLGSAVFPVMAIAGTVVCSMVEMHFRLLRFPERVVRVRARHSAGRTSRHEYGRDF